MTPISPLTPLAPVDASSPRPAVPGFADLLAEISADAVAARPAATEPTRRDPALTTSPLPATETTPSEATGIDAIASEATADDPRPTLVAGTGDVAHQAGVAALVVAVTATSTNAASAAAPAPTAPPAYTMLPAPTVAALDAVAALHGAVITDAVITDAVITDAVITDAVITDAVVATDAVPEGAAANQPGAAVVDTKTMTDIARTSEPAAVDAQLASATAPQTEELLSAPATAPTDLQNDSPAASTVTTGTTATTGDAATSDATTGDAAVEPIPAPTEGSAPGTTRPGDGAGTTAPTPASAEAPDHAVAAPVSTTAAGERTTPVSSAPTAAATPSDTASTPADAAFGAWKRTQLRHARVEAVVPTHAGDVAVSARTDAGRIAVVLGGAGATHVDRAALQAALGDLNASVTVNTSTDGSTSRGATPDRNGTGHERSQHRDAVDETTAPRPAQKTTPATRHRGVLDAHA
jgi:hypothetical protein